jgi:SSS family solute:Na+ symporter
MHGGWLAVLHRYPSALAQGFWTIVFAFSASLLVAAAVSCCTDARQETELKGLVYSLTPRPTYSKLWWQRPQSLALVILLLAAVLTIVLA